MADPNVVHVVIIETQHGCKIVPPIAILHSGEYVHITNMSGAEANLHFPNDIITWDEGDDPSVLRDGGLAIGRVNQKGLPGTHFEYSCYCNVTHPHHAEGNSHPRFIVR